MAKQLTFSQLTAHLFRLLTTKVQTIRVRKAPHGEAAGCTYDKEVGGEIAVRVDHMKDGILGSVIHELLHYVFDEELKRYSPAIEENMILGLEDEIVFRILKRRATTDRWRRAIEERLR